MRIDPLPLKFNFNGKEDTIYPTLVRHQSEIFLVDCGYPGFSGKIGAALNQHELSLSDLTGIIITHHDYDHMGALFELKQMLPNLKVYTSVFEKPYVEGDKKSLRLQQAESTLNSLPEEEKGWALNFIEMLRAMKTATVDEIFKDGDFILEELQVIHTPGHMPGHISLYHSESSQLLAGDALVYENNSFVLANPQYTMDRDEAMKSILKIKNLSPQSIICYHGGLINHKVAEKLAGFEV